MKNCKQFFESQVLSLWNPSSIPFQNIYSKNRAEVLQKIGLTLLGGENDSINRDKTIFKKLHLSIGTTGSRLFGLIEKSITQCSNSLLSLASPLKRKRVKSKLFRDITRPPIDHVRHVAPARLAIGPMLAPGDLSLLLVHCENTAVENHYFVTC